MTDVETMLNAVRDTLDQFGLTKEFLKMERQQKVPRASGIYFLFDGDEVVYIGKSTNIHSRLNAHDHAIGKMWDTFTIFECNHIMMGALESVFIGAYRPRYNKQGL